MKVIKYTALAMALGSTSALAADCEAPATPELPDGATASMEQMLAGQKAVKAFQAANLEYMKCLEPGLTAAEAAVKEGAEGAAESYQAAQETYNACRGKPSDDDLAKLVGEELPDVIKPDFKTTVDDTEWRG